MKLVFLTNLLHSPLSREFMKFYGDNYRAIVTQPFSKKLISMCGEDLHQMPCAVRAYESQENMQLAHKLILESDHLIIGGIPMEPFWDIIEQRIKSGKILFEYSERLFKYWYSSRPLLTRLKMLLVSRFSPLKKHVMRRKYKGSHTPPPHMGKFTYYAPVHLHQWISTSSAITAIKRTNGDIFLLQNIMIISTN